VITKEPDNFYPLICGLVGARVRCLRSYCDDLTGEVLAVKDGTITVHWDDDDPAPELRG
jgi:hypothetical protein